MVARILAETQEAEYIGFFTLTSLPGADWPYLNKAFQRYIRWLRRSQPDLKYVASRETGAETGMKHIHVIAVPWRFVPWQSMRQEWARLTGAWNVDVRRVPGPRAGSYIAKYVAKGNYGLRKNVTFSRSFAKLPKEHRWIRIDDWQPYSPPADLGMTSKRGELYQRLAVQCPCVEDAHPYTREEYAWLKFLMARSPPLYEAA